MRGNVDARAKCHQSEHRKLMKSIGFSAQPSPPYLNPFHLCEFSKWIASLRTYEFLDRPVFQLLSSMQCVE